MSPPLLLLPQGSNLDFPDSESGVLPITPGSIVSVARAYSPDDIAAVGPGRHSQDVSPLTLGQRGPEHKPYQSLRRVGSYGPQERFELPTRCLQGSHSDQAELLRPVVPRDLRRGCPLPRGYLAWAYEQVTRFELALPTWKEGVLDR